MGFRIANKSNPSQQKDVSASNVMITNYANGKKGNNAIEIFVQDGKTKITGTDGNGKPTGTKGGLRSADFNSQKYDFMEKLINSNINDGANKLTEADLKEAMKNGINGTKVTADKNCAQNGKYTVQFKNGEVLTFDFETRAEAAERKAAKNNFSRSQDNKIPNDDEMKLSPKSDFEKLCSKIYNFFF